MLQCVLHRGGALRCHIHIELAPLLNVAQDRIESFGIDGTLFEVECSHAGLAQHTTSIIVDHMLAAQDQSSQRSGFERCGAMREAEWML